MHIDPQTTNSVAVVGQKSSDTSQTTMEVKPIDGLVRLVLVDDNSSDATMEMKASTNGLGLLGLSLAD